MSKDTRTDLERGQAQGRAEYREYVYVMLTNVLEAYEGLQNSEFLGLTKEVRVRKEAELQQAINAVKFARRYIVDEGEDGRDVNLKKPW